jgi:hypothetical protein
MTKYPKLPKQFKRKWVAALRSGKFKQAQESLYNDGGYCCLGVACVIHAGRKIRPKNTPMPTKALLPKEVFESLFTGKEYMAGKLASMNDEKNWSFNRIAAWIEKTL